LPPERAISDDQLFQEALHQFAANGAKVLIGMSGHTHP
jgi:hypothetical protein